MNRKLKKQINWLKKLSEGLKTLKDEEFSRDYIVDEWNEEKTCGVVCGAFGWMPKFVPESGVKWVVKGWYLTTSERPEEGIFSEIDPEFITFMFQGGQAWLKINGEDKYYRPNNSLFLGEVIKRIDGVIQHYEDEFSKVRGEVIYMEYKGVNIIVNCKVTYKTYWSKVSNIEIERITTKNSYENIYKLLKSESKKIKERAMKVLGVTMV